MNSNSSSIKNTNNNNFKSGHPYKKATRHVTFFTWFTIVVMDGFTSEMPPHKDGLLTINIICAAICYYKMFLLLQMSFI